jgi:peptide/nickel transport system substrate-binding protein
VNLLSSWRKKISSFFSAQNKQLREFQKQHRLDMHLVSSLNKSKFPTLKQLKHLPKMLNKKEKRTMGVLTAIVLLGVILLITNLYFLVTTPIPQRGGQYTEGLIGAPRFINPLLSQTNDVDQDISKLIFSGLLKFDKDRILTPDLAESYEISDNQLVYTFHLRQNIKWHDGEPFKADDVIFTMASIQDPEFKSPLSISFQGIMAEKIDDNTIKFTLKEPFAPFLGLMTFGILPEHLWYNVPATNADLTELNKKPIGTGSWQFDSFKKDKNGIIFSYTLIPNPYYYGDRPNLEKIVFKFYGDFASAIDALKNKSVQAIAYLPQEFQTELKKYKNINYQKLDQPQYTAMFFNQKNNGFLQADYIRQALALSIDKQKIIDTVLPGNANIIDTPTLPGVDTNPDIKKYNYDPQSAVTLLEKNGWQLNSTTTNGITQQVRQKKNQTLEITITTVDQPQNSKIADLIKQDWEQIGIKTNIQLVDKSKILQDVINTRKYEVLLFGENLGSDPDPFPFWHSSQNEYPGLNLAIFSNKTVDQLLENARKTNDWEARKKNYLEFQKIVAQELPAIFLYNQIYIYPQDNSIKGFDVKNISAPSDRFANLYQWYEKTKRIWK